MSDMLNNIYLILLIPFTDFALNHQREHIYSDYRLFNLFEEVVLANEST